MNSKNIQKNISERSFDSLKGLYSCEVRRTSVEIMLERFCNGKEIAYPFS